MGAGLPFRSEVEIRACYFAYLIFRLNPCICPWVFITRVALEDFKVLSDLGGQGAAAKAGDPCLTVPNKSCNSVERRVLVPKCM